MNFPSSITQILNNDLEDTLSQFHMIENCIEREASNTLYQIKQLLIAYEESYIKFESAKPFYINVIKAAARGRLKETAHSIILHNLLHHPAILSSFLEDILYIDGATFTVDDISYPDKNRIDLSLANSSKFLIVENKVNSAEEQPGQIYRYYTFASNLGYKDEDIIILYLNPYSSEPPTLYSRSKDGVGKEGFASTIPIDKIIVRDYKHDILNWLRRLEKYINRSKLNEPYLSSAICQYIDYLEDYFELKDIYKELHKMTEKQIRDLFCLDESLPLEAQIEFLNDKKDSITRLSRGLDILLSKLSTKRNREFLSNVLQKLSQEYKDRIRFRVYDDKNPEIGFDVEYKGTLLHVTFILHDQSTPYWRIYGKHGLQDSLRKEIKELISRYINDAIIDNKKDLNWDVYKLSSIENCQLRLKQLADIFLSSEHCKVL